MFMIREGKVPGWEVNFVQYKCRYLITPQLLPLAKKKKKKREGKKAFHGLRSLILLDTAQLSWF